ncbi:DUF421 domain-containing protein [Ectobacillus polymachus]|uniref:DUF421 domain-containing protein n=1 Tax=Ectobacillus polymachus TaxID=1508806 RepID=UPI003A858FDE
MNGVIESILRSSLSFLFLLLMANKLGKVVNTKGSYYNFVFYITIGSVAANLGFNINLKFWQILASFLAFTCIAYFLAYMSANNRFIRKWISGKPMIIIEDGNIVEANMKKLNFSIDMLQQFLREKDVFHMNEVEYAILENNGTLSILKKEAYRSPTKQDFDMLTNKHALPLELIINGEFIYKNLQSAVHNKDWLLQKLTERKLSLKDVQYAVLSSAGLLFIHPYLNNNTK